jgi:hypothetical protein
MVRCAERTVVSLAGCYAESRLTGPGDLKRSGMPSSLPAALRVRCELTLASHWISVVPPTGSRGCWLRRWRGGQADRASDSGPDVAPPRRTAVAGADVHVLIDPAPQAELRSVVGLDLHPLENPVELCVDEPQMWALEQTAPSPSLRGLDTRRQPAPTTSSTAPPHCLPHSRSPVGGAEASTERYRHQELVASLKQVAQQIRAVGRTSLWNLATHEHPPVRAWLDRFTRVQLYSVPASGCPVPGVMEALDLVRIRVTECRVAWRPETDGAAQLPGAEAPAGAAIQYNGRRHRQSEVAVRTRPNCDDGRR